jgi:hypothetical protein
LHGAFPRAWRRQINLEARKARASFLKKEAKNFFELGRAGATATGPNSGKFLRRFFQKAPAFF